MNHVIQAVETGNQTNDAVNPSLEFGEVIDLHPVYTAMERAREAAEANGTEPADVVWDPAWPDLPIDNDDYWNDLVERNWETLSRWYAMSLAAARKGKVLHFKVRDGVETVTEIETAPASTASEMVPEPMRAIIPPLDRIGPQQAASAATTPRTFPTAAPQELTDLRLKLHGNGYHPVPVIGAHIKDKAAGKRPTMTAWQTKCLTAEPHEIASWSRSQRNNTNTGILCGEIVGIDIDVLDEALSARLAARARELFGHSRLCRIGRAPKMLLLYRVETPHDKLSTSDLLFDDGSKAKVEILAEGQQFVAFGIHPETRAQYFWPEQSPLDIAASDVPLVTLEALEQFVAESEQILRAAGGRTQGEIKGKTTKLKSEKKEQDKREQKGKIAGAFRDGEKQSREKIADALDHIPNDLSYDDWIRIGFALYEGTNGEGLDLWEKFSAKYPDNDPKTTAEKWPTFAKGRSITVATLFHYASLNGWRNGGRAAGAPPNRPMIRIVGGELPSIVTAAEQALISGEMGIFQRGSLIVRPAHSRVDIADGNTTSAIRLAPVRPHLLVELMTLAAQWERFDMKANDWVPIDCPHRVAETYLARDGVWNVPVLTGMVNCPVLRPDGSILEIAGYDSATGLLYDPQGMKFSPVPERPDKEDALRALAVLKDLLSTFPFVTDADRSVALSGILTAIHRRSIPTAPAHCLTAPVAGSGKSMLVDIASEIADGRRAAVMSLGKTDEEAEKRLASALIAGDSIISIDNIDREFGGELYCQALTQTSLRLRVLGFSKLVNVPSNATMFANGNNLTLVGDMTRRAMMCTMNPGVERPELRVFSRNPLDMVRTERDKYVIAALTILRAFHLAGRPSQKSPLGSFSEWSSWIRDALIWLGEADPCDTMEKVRQNDPKLGAVVAVISQWAEVVGYDVRVTTKELIDYAIEKVNEGYSMPYSKQDFAHPELREALLIVAGDGGSINGRRLGIWLGANENRLVQGCKIVRDGERGGVGVWKLKSAGESTKPPGIASIRTNF
jgi:putative DNA primase/helicase